MLLAQYIVSHHSTTTGRQLIRRRSLQSSATTTFCGLYQPELVNKTTFHDVTFNDRRHKQQCFYSCTAAQYKSSAAPLPEEHHHQYDLDIDRFTKDSQAQFFQQMESQSFDTSISFRDQVNQDSYELPRRQPQTQQSPQLPLVELLKQFNPEIPPKLEDFATREEGLSEIQRWLECDALEESVAKYQRVVDDARNRNDYVSLTFVERQVAKWFVQLQEAIEKKQRAYLTKEQEEKDRALSIFGPLMCVLPSAKLAVIVAHQAIIQCATGLKEGEKTYHAANCARFVRLALTIGQCVEDELVVHKLLHKRALEEARDKPKTKTSFESNVSAIMDKNNDDQSAELTDIVDPQNITHKWSYTTTHLKEYLDEVGKYKPTDNKRRVLTHGIKKARKAAEGADSWTTADKAQLGSALLHILLETATIDQNTNSDSEMAFHLEMRWMSSTKCQSFVTMNDQLLKIVACDDIQSLSASATRHRPMVVPPKPWTAAKQGGYMILETDIMRYHGSTSQKEAICSSKSNMVFDGLNALSKVKWVINKKILEVAEHCWTDNIPLGDIPSRTDYELPEEPQPPMWKDKRFEKGTDEYDVAISELLRFRDKLMKYQRTKQKNADLVSLRCSTMLKLDQAEKFKEFEAIYFPYNMDFRGRAYPIPPHFSNVGSDLCRGLLLFADKKPLGDRGLFWLKVHLANLAGKDKMTFEARAQFVDEHLDKVRESSKAPFEGERWWMTLENPFQGLAACHEIVNAIDSGDPSTYMCSLAIHMDGSCNGLQHYAALGLDKNGGKAVNLCLADQPQDVYVGVMHEVIRRVADEAQRTLDFDTSNVESLSASQRQAMKHNRAAKLVDGLIDRGVVKRTVMTSVYGVTYVGARQQIQEKIEQKLEGKGHDLDEMNSEIFNACGYLANVTLEVIGDLFSGAKSTMNWLTACARLITQHGYPVAWISPIGLPAVQPYRQKKITKVLTLTQYVTLTVNNDDLPIHKTRQCSAFPPNFIHSLDSSHMLLTALEMDRRGLTFSAVHDSFWTHPCDVDEMNCALRDTFVDLYSQPLLKNLKETWELRYPDVNFPDLPEGGDLKLSDVKNASYFFQ